MGSPRVGDIGDRAAAGRGSISSGSGSWVGTSVRCFGVEVFFVYSSSLLVWGGRCPSVHLCWALGQGLCLLASRAGQSCWSQRLPGLRDSQQLPQHEDVRLSDSEKLVF